MQSAFTVYVPVPVAGTMLPFRLIIPVSDRAPFPSKVIVLTLANGTAGGGDVTNPLALWAKVPFSVALEHSLSAAFAAGAMPRASAVTAAIVKAFAMARRFIGTLLFSENWVRASSFALM